jgi:hypothetical protein
MRLLGIRLELLLERGELRERRIRIGLAVAAVPALASPLDVFRAQIRIALRTVAPRGAVGTIAARGAAAAIPTILPVGALLLIGSRRARAIGTLAPIGMALMAAVLRALIGRGGGFGRSRHSRHCNTVGDDGRGIAGCCDRRRIACRSMRPALTRRPR